MPLFAFLMMTNMVSFGEKRRRKCEKAGIFKETERRAVP